MCYSVFVNLRYHCYSANACIVLLSDVRQINSVLFFIQMSLVIGCLVDGLTLTSLI